MITIKLPYQTSKEDKKTIKEYQKRYSTIVRRSYRMFEKGLSEKDIREVFRDIDNDKWFEQSAIKQAKWAYIKDKKTNENRIWGGRDNFEKRAQNKITKEEWRECRLLPLMSIGEISKRGNRKVKFDISNNQITLKLNKSKHIEIKLPNLANNYKRSLLKLEGLANNKEVAFTFSIKQNYLYITYDESIVDQLSQWKQNDQISAGIDTNPNYIGFTILRNNTPIYYKLYDLNNLNKTNTNKKNYEISKIADDIFDKLKHYQVSILGIEKISVKKQEHNKGRVFNRTVNNIWKRETLFTAIRKRCLMYNLRCVEVPSYYSSIEGNLKFELPDACASAAEVANRAQEIKTKGKWSIKPVILCHLSDLWKKTVNDLKQFKDNWDEWKSFTLWLKTAKLKYRSSHPLCLEEFSCASSYVTVFAGYNRSY